MQEYPRRKFLKNSAAFLSATSFLSGNISSADEKKNRPPNIVVIVADDMGWNDIGYNNPKMITPNLDRLAREGLKFTQHYATPTCTPTRVGLLTGKYPSRFGVTGPDYGRIFYDDTVTLAAALQKKGYHTAISGKWHMGSPPEYTPLKYGFDSSYGYFHGQCDPYTHNYKTGVKSWHRNDEYLDEEGHATDLISEEAVRVIEESDKPFFLYVTYSVPHFPLKEPEKWTDMYKDVEEDSRRWYCASITHMDAGIGKIVQALDRKQIRENTLILYTSDNGGQKSWHSDTQYQGRYADKPHTVLGDNDPYRGWKGQVYEGGIRIPAFINWKGIFEPGTVSAPLHVVDWMPTLCKLADYDPPDNLEWDGVNVWPCLNGNCESIQPCTMYWDTGRMKAVRHGDWKLVIPAENETELYNLAKDPYEKKDVSKEYPQKVEEMKELMKTIQKKDRPKLKG